MTEFPGQVQCIFLRNTSATDPGDQFPYDTSGFENIDQSKYMFFVNSEDLTGLDIANGQCYNQSVAQNLTFGYQGLPLGIGETSAVNGSATGQEGGANGNGNGNSAGALSFGGVQSTFVFAAALLVVFWQVL